MADPAPETAPDRFTVRELIQEAQRETAMRRHLYEKQIRAGRMSREQADRQIDLMEAIVRRLTRTAAL
jgi:hypothetical protein